MLRLCLCLLLVAVAVRCADEYTNKYDSLDLDEVLANKRLTNAYIKCVKGKGKCTPEGAYLKTHITDALQTGCSKCSRAQQQGVVKVIRYLVNQARADWDELVSIYDPHGVYSTMYREQLQQMV